MFVRGQNSGGNVDRGTLLRDPDNYWYRATVSRNATGLQVYTGSNVSAPPVKTGYDFTSDYLIISGTTTVLPISAVYSSTTQTLTILYYVSSTSSNTTNITLYPIYTKS